MILFCYSFRPFTYIVLFFDLLSRRLSILTEIFSSNISFFWEGYPFSPHTPHISRLASVHASRSQPISCNISIIALLQTIIEILNLIMVGFLPGTVKYFPLHLVPSSTCLLNLWIMPHNPDSMVTHISYHSPIREAFIRKNRKYIGLLPIRGGGSTPRPIYFRFFPEENFYCLRMIYILRNM